MEIASMTIEEMEQRMAGLTVTDETAQSMTDDELEQRATEIGELKAAITEKKAAIEKRAALIEEIKAGEIATVVEEHAGAEEKREEHIMDIMEIRNSAEYGAAYLKAMKTGDDSECRALLSTNVSGGYVPVPAFLETEIKTAWEENKLMNLVKHTYYKGNVKVGFELSASGATVHTEGASAPDEETITIGVVEIKAENIKKWITVSDEALEGTTVDTMGYLFKEIAHKIVEKAEEILVGKITAAVTTSTSSAVCVAEQTSATIAEDTIVNAIAKLSGQARDLYLVMNRGTYAALVSVGLKAKYNVDVFDGLKDRIVFTDKLKAFGDATTGDAYVIAGDFGYGAQANFPNGSDMTIKVDDLSLAEKDLVKVVGRQYVGMALVAEKAFVRIVK